MNPSEDGEKGREMGLLSTGEAFLKEKLSSRENLTWLTFKPVCVDTWVSVIGFSECHQLYFYFIFKILKLNKKLLICNPCLKVLIHWSKRKITYYYSSSSCDEQFHIYASIHTHMYTCVHTHKLINIES